MCASEGMRRVVRQGLEGSSDGPEQRSVDRQGRASLSLVAGIVSR
jgi:hypothetical protein